MKIKSLKLTNFQAHRERVVKFSPLISTIKGATDKGKSAILRALGWCCLNNIPGDEFIREGEKSTTVSIATITDDFGEKIKRTRSASGVVNTYEMGEEIFKAFGQGVPDPIEKHLALSPINFQGQHDAPFWFSETAGEVSRRLNAVIDLSVIDSSLSAVAQEVRRNAEKKSLCEERLATVIEELKTLEPQQERVEEFQRLEALHKKSVELNDRFNHLDGLIKAIRNNPAKQHEARFADATKVFQLAKTARGLTDECAHISRFIDDAKIYQAQSVLPPDPTKVDNTFKQWQEINDDIDLLSEHIEKLEENETKVSKTKNKLAWVEIEFKEQTKGKNCPLCGSPMK